MRARITDGGSEDDDKDILRMFYQFKECNHREVVSQFREANWIRMTKCTNFNGGVLGLPSSETRQLPVTFRQSTAILGIDMQLHHKGNSWFARIVVLDGDCGVILRTNLARKQQSEICMPKRCTTYGCNRSSEDGHHFPKNSSKRAKWSRNVCLTRKKLEWPY